MGIIRQKQQQNGQKTKSRTKRGKIQLHQGRTVVRVWGTTVHASHHRQTVVGSVPPGPLLLELRVLASFGPQFEP